MYKLIKNGETYLSETKGTLGGYNGRDKIYGKLDCPSALKWIEKGFYTDKRVFFANEYDAIESGYRPCGVCEKEKYSQWKENPEQFNESITNQFQDLDMQK